MQLGLRWFENRTLQDGECVHIKGSKKIWRMNFTSSRQSRLFPPLERRWEGHCLLVDDYIAVVLGDLGDLQGVLDPIGFPFEGEGEPAIFIGNGAFQ